MDEPWRIRDDSPFPRHEWNRRRTRAIGWIALLVIAAAAAGGYYYWENLRRPQPAPVAPPPPPAAPVAPAPPPVSAAPAILHPLAPAPAQPLPALEQSDAAMRAALEKLVGAKVFEALFHPERIIVRIVATVDSLPRKTVPENIRPVRKAPGAFGVEGAEGQWVIGAANAARYAPYVRLARALDAQAAVDLYVRFYPLFQDAYRQLGYPKGYFNDRLIEAIDDLLAAPEPKGPVKLARPKVLYEYADPALERLSAGQKIMIRIGSANEAVIKAKLREIRAQLATHAP